MVPGNMKRQKISKLKEGRVIRSKEKSSRAEMQPEKDLRGKKQVLRETVIVSLECVV